MTQSPREMLDALLAHLDVVQEDESDTDPGPAGFAGLWEGELETDLTEPVSRQIRFDQFVREVVSLGADIALRMGAAALEYSVGHDEQPVGEDDDAGVGDPTNGQSEE